MSVTPIQNIAKIILVTKALLRNQDKYLIIKRAADDRFDAGQWDLPGGKMERDESIKQSLIMEVREETGINIKESDVSDLAAFDDHASEYSKYPGFWYIMLCCEAKTSETKVILSEEHSEYKWVTADDLSTYLTRPAFLKVIENIFKKN